MDKKMKAKYDKMWREVVLTKANGCVWCRDVGRTPQGVIQGDHMVGKPNLILRYMLKNGQPLCRSCNYRKGNRMTSTFQRSEAFMWMVDYYGEDYINKLLSYGHMNAKNNADVLQRVLSELENAYVNI